MAFQHLYFSAQTEYGSRLRSALGQVEDGLARLIQTRDAITFMIDGDGSSSTMFTEVTTRFAFADNATAQAAWNELNSYIAKETTDGTVDHVDAARKQLMNKLR